MKLLNQLKQRARLLKREIHALWLAYRDPRTPWHARVLIACIIAYALSPIDLIPDPIPIIGYLDDLVLLSLGIALAIRLIPDWVMADCRKRAHETASEPPSNWKWFGATLVVLVWLLVALSIWRQVSRWSSHAPSASLIVC